MDHIAKLEGSNGFFARRAAYNAKVKLRRGDTFRAQKHLNIADACLRAGGRDCFHGIQHSGPQKNIFGRGCIIVFRVTIKSVEHRACPALAALI